MVKGLTPVVVVSKCLGFDHCRYNGQTIPDKFVEKLKKFVEFQPVCPEVEIGLGIPRDPIRIVELNGKKQLFQPATGRDVTAEMERFVESYFGSIGEVEGFILKNRSPSCGPNDVKIYKDRENSAAVKRGSGMFGGEAAVLYHHCSIEDEGRLKNFTIREYFLVKLFTLARFRQVKQEGDFRDLVQFHTWNKLLFMAYNQSKMREMGRIVANHEKLDFSKVLLNYERCLHMVLAKMPKFTSMINVLLHAFGGFSKQLSSSEKKFFLNSIEEYRDERVPLSALIQVLEAWSIGKSNDYLLQQTFISPYPRELVEITDSGKGRKL
jgi:uncharacterized protein YbgA (DUF1722 family)/uncharacterized protein YbbK (DUF523 family)